MRARESLYPADWFRVAGKDLERTRKRLAEGDVEDAAFHLQQALEKYLKGWLLARGWRLKRIHDIEALLDDAVHFNRSLERYRLLCQRVAGYYLAERYPSFEDTPGLEEVTAAHRAVRQLLRALKVPPTRPRRA